MVVGSGCRVNTAPGDAGAQNGAGHTSLPQKIQCPESLEHLWQKVGSHRMSDAEPGLTSFTDVSVCNLHLTSRPSLLKVGMGHPSQGFVHSKCSLHECCRKGYMDRWMMGKGRVGPLIDDGSGSSVPPSSCPLLPPGPSPHPTPHWDPSQPLFSD